MNVGCHNVLHGGVVVQNSRMPRVADWWDVVTQHCDASELEANYNIPTFLLNLSSRSLRNLSFQSSGGKEKIGVISVMRRITLIPNYEFMVSNVWCSST